MHTFEDAMKAIAATSSPFGLAGDFPILKEGLADLAQRLRALEAIENIHRPEDGGNNAPSQATR